MYSTRAIALAFIAIELAAVVLISCGSTGGSPTNIATTPPPPDFTYVPIPAGFGFPEAASVIDGWIEQGDQRSINRHAWGIWAGLTAPSGQGDLPIWETWYSAQDVFVPQTTVANINQQRAARHLEPPRQSSHPSLASTPSQNDSADVVSDVRYNLEATNHVLTNTYNLSQTLTNLNNSWSPDTPILNRDIQVFPSTSVALKPTFWVISQTALTALPVWDGPAGKDPYNDGPSTWSTCVLVDPTNQRGGSTAQGGCNGTSGEFPVVNRSAFYSFQLTATEAEDYNNEILGGTPTAKQNDYAILVGMHVTTKETVRWTWQTFWWVPDPDGQLAFPAQPGVMADRPDTITGPWLNYTMCTAYEMVTPVQPVTGGTSTGTTPLLCYNPYLETALSQPATSDSPAFAGTNTNCMSCHANAHWPGGGSDPGYVEAGYIDLGGPDFADVTKMDFLWSISDRATN